MGISLNILLSFLYQVIHFTAEDVATFIAGLGVLSVVSQVNINNKINVLLLYNVHVCKPLNLLHTRFTCNCCICCSYKVNSGQNYFNLV